MILKAWVLIFVLAVTPVATVSPAAAQHASAAEIPGAILHLRPGADNQHSLSRVQSVFCSRGNETFAEIASPAFESRFLPHPAPIGKGYIDETCWLRFRLMRDAGTDSLWWFEVSPPFLDYVDFYLSDDAGRLKSVWHVGDRMPFTLRPLPHRHFAFPLTLPDAEPVTIYLRVKTTSTMRVITELSSPQAFLLAAEHDVGIYMGYAGFMTLSLVINLMLWFWMREKIFALYSLYLLTLLSITLALGGFLSSWLFPSVPFVADRALGVLFCMVYLTGLLFFDHVLALSKKVFWGRLTFMAIGAIYVVGIFAAAVGRHDLTAPIVQQTGLIVTLFITLAGPVMIWNGRRDLTLYVAAFILQLMGSVLTAFVTLGWIELATRTDYITVITSLPHVILLNLALGYRMRETERRRHELALTEHRVRLENQSLEQDRQFMAMVSHEFRNPLAVIDTSAQRIARSSDGSAPSVQERCENIRRAASDMRLLMDDFLASDRIARADSPLQLAPCSPQELLLEIEREWESPRLRCESESLPEVFTCDRSLVKIAISNLLSNALRYSPADKPVELSAKVDHHSILICVTDQGIGLSDDEKGKIFQKYFRGQRVQTQTGAGLGLHIVDWVVRDHGGEVLVKSAQGLGSRFCLRLPFKPITPVGGPVPARSDTA